MEIRKYIKYEKHNNWKYGNINKTIGINGNNNKNKMENENNI